MLIYTVMGYDALFAPQTPQDNCVPVCTKLSGRYTRLTAQNTQVGDLLRNVIQNKKKM